MSDIFSLWGAALRRRSSVYWQLLLTSVAAALVLVFGLVLMLTPHGLTAVGWLMVVLMLAIISFGYGAAMGAVGEAVRAESATSFWQRGLRLWARTLGFYLVSLALGGVVLLVIGLVLGVVGVFTALQAALRGGLLPSPTALALIAQDIGLLFAITIVLSLAIGPFFQALQAGIYAGDLPVGTALSQAFPEGYGRGRYWHWLLVILIGLGMGIVSTVLQHLLGVFGSFLGILLFPLIAWLQTALAFAAYQVHRSPPHSAPIEGAPLPPDGQPPEGGNVG